MDFAIQAVLLSVSDLDRSVDFFQSVLNGKITARDDQAAVLLVTQEPRPQVLVLRGAMVRNPQRSGGGSLGVRFLLFETSSLDDLNDVERRLTEQHAFDARRSGDGWELVIFHDPDRNFVGLSASTTDTPITGEAWTHIDDVIYSIAW